MMKQRHAVIVLLVLIAASGLMSLWSYRATEQLVTRDMNRALALALERQQGNVISADTVRAFNNSLRLEKLRGRAVLAVDTRQREFRCVARCSAATVLLLSDQRPASALWLAAVAWAMYCFRRYRRLRSLPGDEDFGGLWYSVADGRFVDARGTVVRLTPMQRQLMELFFRSPAHRLTREEICRALWPKKEDASETLYTLVRRLRPVIEQHSDLKIETDRGRAYELKLK